jgi:putative NADH-flavin reductase
VIHGEFQDSGRVRQVVQGTDAVCCVLGARPPYVDVFCAAATRAIMDVMAAAGCRRLLCVTGAMIGDVPTLSQPMSWLRAWFRWRRPAVARDREDQETAVADSSLEWTIVKPPRLTDAGPCGRMVAGPVLPVGLRSSLCRADLASFLLDEVAGPRFVRQRVIVQRGS